jgi:thioredoxin reductase
MILYDLIIVGGGPAGITAGAYSVGQKVKIVDYKIFRMG